MIDITAIPHTPMFTHSRSTDTNLAPGADADCNTRQAITESALEYFAHASTSGFDTELRQWLPRAWLETMSARCR